MKVLVTGVYSAGKTSLVEALHLRLTKDGVDGRVRRDIGRESPLPINRSQTIQSSIWLISHAIREETRLTAEGATVVLCDRGIPDIWSHTLGIPTEQMDQHLREIARSIARAWTPTYDMTFRALPDPTFAIDDDGVRVTDRDYQMQLDAALTEALHELGCEPITLPSTLSDRVSAVLSEIQSYLAGGVGATKRVG